MGSSFSTHVEPVTQDHLTVLSWNIDGLHEKNEERAVYISKLINTVSPDVIMLQEVVDVTMDILQKKCSDYCFSFHRKYNYYNAVMFKNDPNLCISANYEWIEFSNTKMGRCLLVQELNIFDIPFTILTTHLESKGNSADIRKEQLQTCFDSMTEYLKKSNVIFSGDLNIREHEIQEMGGPPQEIVDAWEFCGSNTNSEYTWDMKLNDNLSYGGDPPRTRYDRMYYGSMVTNGIKCIDFQLVGTERIEGCNLFPSDHFAILSKFAVILDTDV